MIQDKYYLMKLLVSRPGIEKHYYQKTACIKKTA